MLFEREQDALTWYESEERVLTPTFLATIPWHEVKHTPITEDLLPVLAYMRDVEKFTDIYYQELLHTPTGKDPIIRRFMDRWSTEEPVHADLLHRFLEEAGMPACDAWYEKALAKIPRGYRPITRLMTTITNAVGKKFSAVHMTWGAINEYSTLCGYRRLWEMAEHPVLEYILKAIAREEARHSFFYWSVARLQLMRSGFSRSLARTIINRFWSPVGEGTKPAEDINLVIRTLFGGTEGIAAFDRHVTQRIEQLPGFTGVKTITERIAAVSA